MAKPLSKCSREVNCPIITSASSTEIHTEIKYCENMQIFLMFVKSFYSVMDMWTYGHYVHNYDNIFGAEPCRSIANLIASPQLY